MEAKTTQEFVDDKDLEKELQAFHKSKSGVKGLLDSGVKNVPKIFIRPSEDQNATNCRVSTQGPVINFEGVEKKERRDEIAKEVLSASKEWGFFQIVNHGVPVEVIDKLQEGCRMFHDQDAEAKKEFYTRDLMKQVAYTSNNEFYKVSVADWRDFLTIHEGFDPKDLPEMCRDVVADYTNHVLTLGDTILELLSIGLGVSSIYVKEERKWYLVNNYYPPCPAPELTLGIHHHTDGSIISLLVQDQIGGLQVLHEDQWVDIEPIPGAIAVITGELLEILSNDLIKSVYHRATAKQVGPRVSTAVFLIGDPTSPNLFGPIKELISEQNPPIYAECTVGDYYRKAFNGSGSEHRPDYAKLPKQGSALHRQMP